MQKSWMGGWKWAVAAAAGLALLTGAACGSDDDNGGDDETAAVEQAMNDVFSAWNAKDVDAFNALFTDEGVVAVFGEEGQSAEEVRADFEFYIGSDEITTQRFIETAVDGEAATTDVEYAVGDGLDRSEFAFVSVDGAWKVNGEEQLEPEIPDDVTTITVQMNEFAFGAAIDELEDGNVAFSAENVGEQEHELALVRFDTDITMDAFVEQLLASEGGEVEGVEFIGQTSAAPGETAALVFAGPLESGRYGLLCLFPDTDEGEDGTPHAMKGMTKEFTIK